MTGQFKGVPRLAIWVQWMMCSRFAFKCIGMAMLEDPFFQKAPPGWKCPLAPRPPVLYFRLYALPVLRPSWSKSFVLRQHLVEAHPKG